MTRKLVKQLGFALIITAMFAQAPLLAEDPTTAAGDVDAALLGDGTPEGESTDTGNEITPGFFAVMWDGFKDLPGKTADVWTAGWDHTTQFWTDHPAICWGSVGTVAAAAMTYTAWLLYEKGKTTTAKTKLHDNALFKQLQDVEARLDAPNLSDSDRKALKSERGLILDAMVTKYFEDKTFVETFKEVMNSTMPGA